MNCASLPSSWYSVAASQESNTTSRCCRAGSTSQPAKFAAELHGAPAFGIWFRSRSARSSKLITFTRNSPIDPEQLARFIAHTAGGGRFCAEQLFVAAGAWSGPFASEMGEPVPLTALGPQMGVTEPVAYAIGPSVGVSSPIDFEGLYFRQIPRGNIVFGGGLREPAYPDRMSVAVAPANTLRQMRELRRFVPGFRRLQLIRVWSGIEGYIGDGRPVIGPSAHVPGLHYAFGFNGEGFAISLGVGECMAELLATGATSTPLDAFSIGRFARSRTTTVA